MTWDPNGPMTHLQKQGIEPTWLNKEVRMTLNGREQWLYTTEFLSTRGVRDIAHLVVDGWNVHVRPNEKTIQIRIHKETK